jgi:hypothetical protein
MPDKPVVDLAAARQAKWLETRLQRITHPDGKCFHCERPANQHYPVGPITVEISDPECVGPVTHEFCSWECLARWAAREAGGNFVTESVGRNP